MGPFENPTQAVGVISFGIAALASLNRWREPAWRLTAALMALLSAEVWFGIRYRIHDWYWAAMKDDVAKGHALLAVAFAVVGAAALPVLVKYLRGSQTVEALLRVLAVTFILCCFAGEFVPIPLGESVLYHDAGGVLVGGWFWLAGALVIIALALWPRPAKGNA